VQLRTNNLQRITPREGWCAFGPAVLFSLILPACFAAVGPSVGIRLSDASPTIGWEVSAATIAGGQVYALRGDRPQPAVPAGSSSSQSSSQSRWVRRTFLVWEPRLGHTVPGSASVLIGGGGTVGAKWDDSAAAGKGGGQFLGGAWAGVAIPIEPRRFDLEGRTDVYVSIAVGIRGDELYLTPKVGVFQEPEVTISAGDFH
jgi:hypothetical protein